MRSELRGLILILTMAAGGLVLTGCGQKGNLYLPNQKQKVPATQPQSPPAAQTSPNSPPTSAPATSSSGAH